MSKESMRRNLSQSIPSGVKLNGAEVVETQCFTLMDDPTAPDSVVEVDPDPYVDPGATADELCYGDVTSRVTKTGEINKQVPGVYEPSPLSQVFRGEPGEQAVRARGTRCAHGGAARGRGARAP